jgi:hypothetical protein
MGEDRENEPTDKRFAEFDITLQVIGGRREDASLSDDAEPPSN